MAIAASQGGTKPNTAGEGYGSEVVTEAQRRFCRRIDSIWPAIVRASTSASSLPVITISLVAWATSAAELTATATSAPTGVRGIVHAIADDDNARSCRAKRREPRELLRRCLARRPGPVAECCCNRRNFHRRVTTCNRDDEAIARERVDRRAHSRLQPLVDVKGRNGAIIIGEDDRIVEAARLRLARQRVIGPTRR